MMQHPRPLAGRTALVTGSTGGLGFAIAARLAAEGADVLLHGLATPGEMEAERAALATRCGVRIGYCQAELGQRAAVAGLMREAASFGGPDILVNNAVTRHFAPIEKLAPDDWEEDIAVNLTAAYLTIHHAMPGMRARNWGRIINLSSIYGMIAAPDRAGYVTTKTALIGLTRAVAMETIRTGITCNAICPGVTLTPAIDSRLEGMVASQGRDRAEVEAEFLAARQPTRRFIDADKLAALVALLCGPAGDDITGTAMPVDGGWSIS